MSEEPDMETVVGLLHDEYARMILSATSVDSLSASKLTKRCDASRQTVYRRLEQLQEAGLVTSQTHLREDGHHDTVYTATFDRLAVELRDGNFEFELNRTSTDASDELTELWKKF